MTYEEMTDFGQQSIPITKKSAQVDEIFETVAPYYDLMNDVMSGGLHRWWKIFTRIVSQIRIGSKVLDIASGTGDLATHLAAQVGEKGQVMLLDRSQKMLRLARDRLINAGFANTQIIQGDAECLPFPDETFDHLTIGFGLRNVTRKAKALLSMQRVLKPGGQLLVLEFSHSPSKLIHSLYSLWARHAIPRLGRWIAKDEASYRYLIESIQRHPDAETLKQQILTAGFARCQFYRLSGGIVALHRAWKA
jgi:demethylmenaquinone methyltransferase / 2-methoxy-6-polyprenyl-1,4-benzoquinol methylase